MAYAHSPNPQGRWQDLDEHLRNVAEGAARFADVFGARDLGYAAGLLHDIGKYAPAWQQYLQAAVRNPRQHPRGPDHKGAGAYQAATLGLHPLLPIIAGHHGGLPVLAELVMQVPQLATDLGIQQATREALAALPELASLPTFPVPSHDNEPLVAELFCRMVFSALVDADFLDTEHHFSVVMNAQRTGAPELADLLRAFEVDQSALSGFYSDTVNAARHWVFLRSLEIAREPPGFFRLTVPTGGGKTRSSLAFALRHAQQHGLRRVIYAIPFTSIIEQTADIFRGIFRDARAVLEHHSAVAPPDPLNPAPDELWARLAAENWDAPLVVTTTVQLFESLLGSSPSACRKLHRLARSVIILDETQMLPTHLLKTILDVLRQLVERYGTTVVLCTATQPALDLRSGFDGLPNITDILPDDEVEQLFRELARVAYRWPEPDERWSWERVAREMRETEQALAIVNTRADALALLAALDDPAALHLSTRLCGAHRRAVLVEVRRRLRASEPCRLVATQVVEAGVDVDFPRVLRALGPLDRIAQAAGRCNREGKLLRDGAPALGEVIIFVPEEGGLPSGAYRLGTQITAKLLRQGNVDPHDPGLYLHYFDELYDQLDGDEPKVCRTREELNYPETSKRFRMIKDDTEPVIVRYGTEGQWEQVRGALAQLREKRGSPRELLRQLQPYIVALRNKEVEQAQRAGLLAEVLPGIWEWMGRYDTVGGRGIVLEGAVEPERTVW